MELLRRHVIGAVLTGLLATTALPSSAQEAAAQKAAGPHIRVSGEGSILSVPDVAIVQLGVESRAVTPGEALDGMSGAMAPVLAGLAAAGIAPRDVQTGQLSLSPVYADRVGIGGGPEIEGYAATTIVTVRVRDLDRLGTLLSEAVGVGANRFDGLSFTLSDSQGARDAALAGAVADATRKARILAQAAGVALGPLVDLTEQGAGRPQPPMQMDMARSESVPIAAGELETTASVAMTFAVVQP